MGSYGETFLNAEHQVVLKYFHNYQDFLTSAKEVRALTLLKDVRGVQKLVGVCPERLVMATKYSGRILGGWMGRDSPLLPAQWVDIFI